MENWRNLPKLHNVVAVTHEEAKKLIQPHICEMCRRWFNPTEEERKKDEEYIKNMDWDFEWEVITPYIDKK